MGPLRNHLQDVNPKENRNGDSMCIAWPVRRTGYSDIVCILRFWTQARFRNGWHIGQETYKCDGVTLFAPLDFVSSATALIILSINNSNAFATQISTKTKFSLRHRQGTTGGRTYRNRCNLGYFSHIFIGLHNLLYSCNRKS
jgi:hypothetical protein